MRWENPDRTESHYPEGACGCGRDLADAADLGVARSYQQHEIPAAPAFHHLKMFGYVAGSLTQCCAYMRQPYFVTCRYSR